MKNLAVGLAVLILVAVRTCRGGCGDSQGEQGSTTQLKRSSDIYKLPASLLKRFYDDDSFVGLMGKRNSGHKVTVLIYFLGEMNDFFVGLMGKRNLQTGNPTEEENEARPDTRYSTKCRMK
uniref:Tachykinin precursor 3 n=1 Tax=Xenopus tropicalis TaxID=8364 RepID=A0A6I8SCI1_XENTR